MGSQEPKNLFMRGALLYAKKPTASAHDWKIRYYILRDLEGNLVGCDVHENELPSTPVGILQLFHAKVKESDPISGASIYPFSVEPASGKAWHLAAKSEQDRVAWKTSLEEAIKLAPSETETERNKHIEKLILQEKKAMSKAPELKMLLLGPGQSGKSTVLKQMKILHCNGFTPSEHEFYRGLCRSNVLDIMKQLLDACESLGLKLGSESKALANTFLQYFNDVSSKTNEENGVYVSSEQVGADDEDEEPDLKKIGKSPRGISGNTSYGALASINGATSPRGPQIGAKSIEIPASIVHCIKCLWKDNIIRHEVLAHAPEYHIPDSTVYFLDDVDRITSSDYKPSAQDILRSRHRTSGVHETIFLIDDTKFRIIDVGGQRGERKKWISFFEDVTAVVYVAAISEYDQKLKEDQTTNRLHEALIVFENVCKMKIFANVPIILFLNKDDIFREKIKKVPLSVCFKKYDGENSYQPARNYIQKKFERRRGFKERIIYTHVICATDTESFKKVSQATQDIILTKALHDAHL